MNPLRTRLVRDVLPIVLVALATVGAMSLGMTALGSWFGGLSWMETSSTGLGAALDLALSTQRLRVAELALYWPSTPRLDPGDGLVSWTGEGRRVQNVDPTVLAFAETVPPDLRSHLVTSGDQAWAVVGIALPHEQGRIALVSAIDDELARLVSEQRKVEVMFGVQGAPVASSLIDLEGNAIRSTMPDLDGWSGEAIRVGTATFPAPNFRGGPSPSTRDFSRGSGEIPAFYAAVRVPVEQGTPLTAVSFVPRAVLLQGPLAGAAVFLFLSVGVTAAAVAALVTAANRHLAPVFRAVQRLRSLIDELARHLGDDQVPRDPSDVDDLSAVESAVRTLDRSIARAIEVTLSLANTRDRAMEASALKSRFLANVSHELRTPLTAILGYTEILEEEAVGDTRADAERIGTAARQLLLLVDDVLDLSRIEAGKMVPDLRPFDLRALLEEVAQLAAPLMRPHGNVLESGFAEDLGEVVLDRARVRQVLLNLVGNAAKFTDHGRIVIRAVRTGPTVRLSVLDTGCGIAADRLPTLFQPFVQAHAATERRESGTGLGLAISAQFTSLMGGRSPSTAPSASARRSWSACRWTRPRSTPRSA
ncbi:MAG: HAMP domain-containing sensor histidine kinase [Myxococcota bacterium]